MAKLPDIVVCPCSLWVLTPPLHPSDLLESSGILSIPLQHSTKFFRLLVTFNSLCSVSALQLSSNLISQQPWKNYLKKNYFLALSTMIPNSCWSFFVSLNRQGVIIRNMTFISLPYQELAGLQNNCYYRPKICRTLSSFFFRYKMKPLYHHSKSNF